MAEKLDGNNEDDTFGGGLEDEEEHGEDGKMKGVSKSSCVIMINSIGIMQMINKVGGACSAGP